MANAVLQGACLGEADMSGAQLDAAVLTGADLRKANLRSGCRGRQAHRPFQLGIGDGGVRADAACSGDCDRPFRPKVITDSGDRDHAVTRPIGPA